MYTSLLMPERSGAALTRVTRYLHGRESPRGGFCFYRSAEVDEPNLFDTYHAVSTLTLLGDPLPGKAALLRFVQLFPPTSQLPALYYRTLILHSLARPDLIESNKIRRLSLAVPAAGHLSRTAALRRMFETVQLKRFLHANLIAPVVVRWIIAAQRDGGFGDKPNLLDTYSALHVLAGLDGLNDVVASAACRFVDMLQIRAYGFTITADSTASSLEVVLAGVQCCKLLHLPVRYPRDIVSFVLACQAADGGMSRVPGALPEIESTHYGVMLLLALADRAAANDNVGTDDSWR